MMSNVCSMWCVRTALAVSAIGLLPGTAAAQAGPGSSMPASTDRPITVPVAAEPAPPPPVPADYVVGAEDVLTVTFRYEKDLSGDYLVRPDGRISLPVVKEEIVAAGLTIDALRQRITEAVTPYVKADPVVNVQPKQINSRRVSITGEVNNQAPVPLLGPMTVLQLISRAGGLTVYAKQKDILIIRMQPDGSQISIPFNYDEVKQGRNLEQNILLKPGDQVIVP